MLHTAAVACLIQAKFNHRTLSDELSSIASSDLHEYSSIDQENSVILTKNTTTMEYYCQIEQNSLLSSKEGAIVDSDNIINRLIDSNVVTHDIFIDRKCSDLEVRSANDVEHFGNALDFEDDLESQLLTSLSELDNLHIDFDVNLEENISESVDSAEENENVHKRDFNLVNLDNKSANNSEDLMTRCTVSELHDNLKNTLISIEKCMNNDKACASSVLCLAGTLSMMLS